MSRRMPIDDVVVERTLEGHAVRLLEKKALPSLDLPKVRRNRHVEILPLSTGCLGACTYCKTKHARGELGSYVPEALAARVATAVAVSRSKFPDADAVDEVAVATARAFPDALAGGAAVARVRGPLLLVVLGASAARRRVFTAFAGAFNGTDSSGNTTESTHLLL